jgi:hypothetical protein
MALSQITLAEPKGDLSSGQGFPALVQVLRERHAQTKSLVAAHAASLRFLPARVLSAELELVCEALRRGQEDARARLAQERALSEVEAKAGAGLVSRGRRLRIAMLAGATRRMESARWCRPGPLPSIRRESPGREVARRLSATLALLDLSKSDAKRMEALLVGPVAKNGRLGGATVPDRWATVLEASEWLGLHDAVVRKVVDLQLTVRPGEKGTVSAKEAEAARRMRKALSAIEQGDREEPRVPERLESVPREMPTTRT